MLKTKDEQYPYFMQDTFLMEALAQREAQGLYRKLRTTTGLIDFCSNDYLGFARSETLAQNITEELATLKAMGFATTGATGSRLLAGNYAYTEALEERIARFHGAEAGLIFNSGYDANLGVLANIPQKGDFLLTDELIHASMIDGARLGLATRYKFRHNDVEDLAKKINACRAQNPHARVFVAVESVYSMDGDTAPLTAIAQLCSQYEAYLIVDEAHATGVFGLHGQGLVSHLGLEKQVFARIITFGKALGCHGAIVLGSEALRAYLINFARSFIYTTAAPLHTHASVKCAYDLLESPAFSNQKLHQLIAFFKQKAEETARFDLLPSDSAIQGILVAGNEACRALALQLQQRGLDIRPIVSPTVPKGKERLRICLHTYNSEEEIARIFD